MLDCWFCRWHTRHISKENDSKVQTLSSESKQYTHNKHFHLKWKVYLSSFSFRIENRILNWLHYNSILLFAWILLLFVGENPGHLLLDVMKTMCPAKHASLSSESFLWILVGISLGRREDVYTWSKDSRIIRTREILASEVLIVDREVMSSIRRRVSKELSLSDITVFLVLCKEKISCSCCCQLPFLPSFFLEFNESQKQAVKQSSKIY
jgi:hypothetical protein